MGTETAEAVNLFEKDLEEKSPATTEALCVEFVRLNEEMDGHKKELDRIKELSKGVESEIMRRFQEGGLNRVGVNGKTVYLRRELWVGTADGVDKATLIRAMKKAGLNDMITPSYNSQTFSAWMRQLPQGEDGIPELPKPLVGKAKVIEKFDIRVIKQ